MSPNHTTHAPPGGESGMSCLGGTVERQRCQEGGAECAKEWGAWNLSLSSAGIAYPDFTSFSVRVEGTGLSLPQKIFF